MDRPTRLAIVPIALLLCGLTGCVVEGPPPPRQVVVERPPPPREVVVERPPPPAYYRPPPPEVVVRP
jgi:hypothetical protein